MHKKYLLILLTIPVFIGAGCNTTTRTLEQNTETKNVQPEIKMQQISSLNGTWRAQTPDKTITLTLTQHNDDISGFHCIEETTYHTQLDCSSLEKGITTFGRISPAATGTIAIMSASNFEQVVNYNIALTKNNTLKATYISGQMNEFFDDQYEFTNIPQ